MIYLYCNFFSCSARDAERSGTYGTPSCHRHHLPFLGRCRRPPRPAARHTGAAAGSVQRRGPPLLAEASGCAGAYRRRRAAAVLLFLRQPDRRQHHPRGDDTRRCLHPRAVLPLAEAGKREHTGMNHGRKQYGALVLRSREL